MKDSNVKQIRRYKNSSIQQFSNREALSITIRGYSSELWNSWTVLRVIDASVKISIFAIVVLLFVITSVIRKLLDVSHSVTHKCREVGFQATKWCYGCLFDFGANNQLWNNISRVTQHKVWKCVYDWKALRILQGTVSKPICYLGATSLSQGFRNPLSPILPLPLVGRWLASPVLFSF